MAYGTKYQMEWATPTADCRVKIQQQGYTSSVTSLTPGTDAFTVTWGQQNREDLTLPLRVSTARMRFMGDADGEMVQEVFDGGDTEYRVLFERDTGSGYTLDWQGFLATDLWRDNPHTDADTVELEVLDGLALLENKDFDPSSSNDLYTTIRNILRGLHQLDVAANMEWYPYREDNQLSGNQLPLSELTTATNAFDELEPFDGDKDFETVGERNQRRVLEAILERFGLELFQSRGEWIVRQRHQIQPDGTIKTWPGHSAVTNDNPTTRDLNRTLGALKPRKRPRGLVQRLRSVESAQTYQDLGELVRNWSFEANGGSKAGWTGEGTVKDIDTTRLTEQATQEDTYVLHLSHEEGSTLDGEKIRQEISAVLHNPGPKGAFIFDWLVSQKENAESKPTLFTEIAFNDKWYAQKEATQVVGDTNPADEGVIALDEPFPGTEGEIIIPRGGFLYGPVSADSPRIELLEPARAGDEQVRAKIPTELPDGAALGYFIWSTETLTYDPGSQYPEQEYRGFTESTGGNPIDGDVMHPQKIVMPINAPDGTILAGKDLSFAVRTQIVDTLLDQVSIKLAINGEPVSETSYTALDDQSGRNIQITQLLGDGPRIDHPRALQLSGVEVTGDWQVGPYASGDTPSGQLLEEMVAEAAMRQQRDTLQRRTHEVELRNEEVWPQDVFTIAGELYTVSYLERTFGTGGDVAQAELSRLKDAGTSGLERTFKMESGDTGSVGGTSGGGGSGDGGSVSAAWGEITGKPDGLFSTNGDSDGIPETQSLQHTDIADLLDHPPGLVDGIQPAIRDSPTDTALPTERAVKDYASTLDGDGLKSQDDALRVDDTVARTDQEEHFKEKVIFEDGITTNGRFYVDDSGRVAGSESG